jgi:hypothetical protein
MPIAIEHIDAIARQKKRGVLFVQFHPITRTDEDACGLPGAPPVKWENLPIRQKIIDWLESHGIGWELCGHFASEHLMMGYLGQVYIDLPYDQTLPAYRELEAFLENPDGTARYPDAWFAYCPLEQALKNSAHDEPGYWDREADAF